MSVLALNGLRGGPLSGITLELGPGCHALLGTPEETAHLVDLMSGVRRPRFGTVLLGHRGPYQDPGTRRRIGALLAAEPPLVGRTIRQALTLALGRHPPAEGVLSGLGLGKWIDRSAGGLSRAEVRAVALAVALATENPLLLALWEPFAHVTGVPRQLVLTRLAEAGREACVVCATSSVRDAVSLGGTVVVIHRGSVVSSTGALALKVGVSQRCDLVVRTERPRELVSSLMHSPAVAGIEWSGAAPRDVRVRAEDAEGAARAIVQASRDQRIPIECLTAEEPSFQMVQSASLAASKAAPERQARKATPAPVPPPASSTGLDLVHAASPLPQSESSPVPLPNVATTSIRLTNESQADVTLQDVTAPASSLPTGKGGGDS